MLSTTTVSLDTQELIDVESYEVVHDVREQARESTVNRQTSTLRLGIVIDRGSTLTYLLQVCNFGLKSDLLIPVGYYGSRRYITDIAHVWSTANAYNHPLLLVPPALPIQDKQLLTVYAKALQA